MWVRSTLRENKSLLLYAVMTDMASGTRGAKNRSTRLQRKKDSESEIATVELTTPAATGTTESPITAPENLVVAVPDNRELHEEVTNAAVNVDPAGTSTTGPKSPELVLSAREKAFIKELRSNTASSDANVLPEPPAASVEETAYEGILGSVSNVAVAEEEAYASILGEIKTFSRVHAHCLGVKKLSDHKLKQQVKKELKVSAEWSDGEKEHLKMELAKALPKLGEVLLKKSSLPVPSTFSANRVVEIYRAILQKYLQSKKSSSHKPSKKRVRFDSSSDKDSVSGDSSASEDSGSNDMSKAVKWHIKSSERSLRIGEDKYSDDHLYECERLLVEYKRWSDPVDPGSQLKTVPHEVRGFVKKHLATPGAPIMQAYDQPHVKKSTTEQKHVTFLLNKMGYLASKVAKERLARAGKELDRFGRIRKGAALSKAERKESIAGEREWSGLVRWLSSLLTKGVEAYKVFQKHKNADASLAHLLVGAPELSRSSVRRAARAVANCKDLAGDESQGREGRRQNYSHLKNKKRRRSTVRITEGSSNKSKLSKRRCWHCNEKGHLTGDCPSAIAGKPPHPKSRFGKSRSKGNKARGADKDQL